MPANQHTNTHTSGFIAVCVCARARVCVCVRTTTYLSKNIDIKVTKCVEHSKVRLDEISGKWAAFCFEHKNMPLCNVLMMIDSDAAAAHISDKSVYVEIFFRRELDVEVFRDHAFLHVPG